MEEKNTKKSMVIVIVVAIILMGGFYYLGYQNGKGASKGQYAGMAGMRGGAAGMMRGGAAGGAVNGSVISKDDTSITVQSKDGSSKIVLYTDSTQVMESTTGNISDVAVGSQVLVQGKANSDGSVTAQSISIRPNMPPANTQATQ